MAAAAAGGSGSGGTHPLHPHEGVGSQARGAHDGEVAALPPVLLLQRASSRQPERGDRQTAALRTFLVAAHCLASLDRRQNSGCRGGRPSGPLAGALRGRTGTRKLPIAYRVLQQPARHGCGCGLRGVPRLSLEGGLKTLYSTVTRSEREVTTGLKRTAQAAQPALKAAAVVHAVAETPCSLGLSPLLGARQTSAYILISYGPCACLLLVSHASLSRAFTAHEHLPAASWPSSSASPSLSFYNPFLCNVVMKAFTKGRDHAQKGPEIKTQTSSRLGEAQFAWRVGGQSVDSTRCWEEIRKRYQKARQAPKGGGTTSVLRTVEKNTEAEGLKESGMKFLGGGMVCV